MSFNIFASGNALGQPFHYERDDCIDGDDFNIVELISTLQGLTPSAAGVAGAAIEHNLPGDAPEGMGVVAFLEFLHTLKNIVDCLAMCDDASNGRITVFTKQKHFFSADDLGYGRYYFYPGNDPGTEFIKAIGRSLEATDMNNWGVLRALVIVLTLYSNAVGQSGKPDIMIQLEK